MAIMANVQPELGWIVYAGSDILHPIRFHSSKEGLDHIVQNRPGSDLDGLVRFQPSASGPEASQCARIIAPSSGRIPLAHCQFFPLSDSVAFFHRWPESCCAKPARIWFGSGWLRQVLAKRIRSGSKPVCKKHPARFWLMLPSWSWSDVNQIQHVYWGAIFHPKKF